MAIPVPGRLAEAVRQSVVKVRSGRRGVGSGVVVSSDRVVTNAHVLAGTSSGRPDISLETWEGSTLDAVAIRINGSRDLALLSVAGLKAKALPFGDSQRLKAGLPVFAIGNPFGFVGAVSSGVIHRTNVPRLDLRRCSASPRKLRWAARQLQRPDDWREHHGCQWRSGSGSPQPRRRDVSEAG